MKARRSLGLALVVVLATALAVGGIVAWTVANPPPDSTFSDDVQRAIDKVRAP